jgi:hypothetical protein
MCNKIPKHNIYLSQLGSVCLQGFSYVNCFTAKNTLSSGTAIVYVTPLRNFLCKYDYLFIKTEDYSETRSQICERLSLTQFFKFLFEPGNAIQPILLLCDMNAASIVC